MADEAAKLIDEFGLELERTTPIGESFGNWVNAGIAKRIGKVDRILAMNPANELSGYRPPCLRRYARVSWSFHAFSLCDTLQPIAHGTIFLDTPTGFDMFTQHTRWIRRLTDLLTEGDDRWLHMSGISFENQLEAFEARATSDGILVPTDLPRKRPEPKLESEPKLEPEQLPDPIKLASEANPQVHVPVTLIDQTKRSKLNYNKRCREEATADVE